jgi:thioredoxin 1
MSKELTETTFKTEVRDYSGSALVDFWAPWCGPCRVMGPIVDNLSQKYDGKVLIAKINVDDNQNLAGEFGIMSIPSILFFKAGKVVHTQLGAMSEAELENLIKQHLL